MLDEAAHFVFGLRGENRVFGQMTHDPRLLKVEKGRADTVFARGAVVHDGVEKDEPSLGSAVRDGRGSESAVGEIPQIGCFQHLVGIPPVDEVG
jgi:hypothetical protein